MKTTQITSRMEPRHLPLVLVVRSERPDDNSITRLREGDDDISPMEILNFLQDTFRKKKVKTSREATMVRGHY